MGIISAIKAICLSDAVNNAARQLLGTRCFTTVAAAIGTTTTKIKTTAIAQYCINGIAYTKAATDDLWTLSGTVIPASGTGRFLLCLNAAGTASVLQGTETTNAELPVDANGIPTVCPVAEVKIVMGSGGSFTPGTTALTGGNIGSVTYTNLSCLPVGGLGTA